MIQFSEIHPDIAEVCKRLDIKEEDLFSRYSDLQIGCTGGIQAMELITSGNWKSMAILFKPEKGTDMEKYDAAVEIPFGYTGYFESKNKE